MQPIKRPLALALIATSLAAATSISAREASPPPRPVQQGNAAPAPPIGWELRRSAAATGPKGHVGGVSLSLSWDDSFAPARLVTTLENSMDQSITID